MIRNTLLSATFSASLALAGCNEAPTEPAAAVNDSAPANPYNDRLTAMQEPLRHATLMRAIIDSGATCKRVIEAEDKGAYQNLHLWAAQCDGAKKWGVFVGADASVQVRECGEMKQLGLPSCD